MNLKGFFVANMMITAGALTVNGISTTTEPDTFRFEEFTSNGKKRVQWDYRDRNGELHSGVARSLDQAKREAKLFGYKE